MTRIAGSRVESASPKRVHYLCGGITARGNLDPACSAYLGWQALAHHFVRALLRMAASCRSRKKIFGGPPAFGGLALYLAAR
jgi:hypothetical protein